MNELHLSGWLCRDCDGILALKERKECTIGHSIMDSIWEFAEMSVDYEDDNLGGRLAVIPNAHIRVYVTNSKCSLAEAMGALAYYLLGIVRIDIGYEGYSEYTITNYYCKDFVIGGHDLDRELESSIGKYIHFILEVD